MCVLERGWCALSRGRRMHWSAILTNYIAYLRRLAFLTFQMSIQAKVIQKGTLKEEKVKLKLVYMFQSKRWIVCFRVEVILKPTIIKL